MEKDIATLDEEEGEITLRRKDMMMDTLPFYFLPLPLRDSPRECCDRCAGRPSDFPSDAHSRRSATIRSSPLMTDF